MSFVSERYDESMRIFTRMLKNYRQIDDGYQRELLLRSYWSAEEQETADTRSWNIFLRLCRRLEDAGAVSVVVRFIWGVFHVAEHYDRARFQEMLTSVPLTPDLSLAELCNDCFRACLEQIQQELPWRPNLSGSFRDVDVYQDDISEYVDMFGYVPGTLTKLLPAYLAEKLYGVRFDLGTVTTEDVDRLAQAIIDCTTMQVENENREIDLRNDETARRETEYQVKGAKNYHVPRRVKKTFTEFDRKYAVPGGLLELYRACELIGRDDICYYILENYVWPVFAIAPWEADKSERVQITAGLAGAYADAMYSQLLGKDPVLTGRRLVEGYSKEQFFAELVGQTEGAIIGGGKRRYAGHGRLARALQITLQKGKTALKEGMDDYLYSFLMAVTPYMLLSTEQQDEAADFLVRHYDEISLYDKRLLYVQVLLTRSILSTKHLATAYALHGYYIHEMNRQKRDHELLSQAIQGMITYIKNAKEYICQSNEYTFDTKQSWHNLLFGDGRIDGMLEKAEYCLNRNAVPDTEEFNALMRVVEAFSYPTGIRLPLLGIPNQDNYDKLPNALSDELTKQGAGYVKRCDEYLAFYHSMNHQELLRDVNSILQHHISKMGHQTLADSLERVERLRKQLRSADEGSEETLRKVEAVYTDLSLQLQKGYIGRQDVELHVSEIERRFQEHYCTGYTGRSLLSKLPQELEQEVHNYLITGETVYRLLTAREDSDSLDFSAAMIPLTKAVEQVLNYIYHQMDVHIYDGLDDKTKKAYFKNGNRRRENIELGPGLWLFKDAAYINVCGGPESYSLKGVNPYKTPHFERWGGEKVVDIAALRELGKEEKKKFLWVDRKDSASSSPIKTAVCFGTDDSQNRMLLVKGLEYIKDHHRNIVAHKDPVKRSKADECRDALLLAEDLLWILLMILKPRDPKGNTNLRTETEDGVTDLKTAQMRQ